ncbi:MAG: PAS domain S-box protein, partial [Chloroflexota bacterium]|nr:PAS domain S-box protein [Chloroflexota bacterium]
VGVFRTSRDGRLLAANPELARILGYPSVEALIAGLTDISRQVYVEPGRRADFARLVEEQGTVVGFESRVYRRDGSTVWISEAGRAVLDEDGGVRWYEGTVQDITARKTAAHERAQRLREQSARTAAETEQHRLAFLAEASALLASSLDYQTTLARVARLAVPFLADGCSVDILDEDGSIRRLAVACADPEREAVARELQARYPIQRDAPAGVANVLRTGRPELYNGDVDTLHQATGRDAEHLALLRRLRTTARMVVPLVARGQILGALSFGRTDPDGRYEPEDLALAEDLAQRAALAIDNARLYESLGRSEERFRSLVQNASDIVAIFAADGTVRYVSPPVARVLGYQPEQIVDSNPFALIHPDDLAPVQEAFSGTVRMPGYHHPTEMRLRHADGSWRVLEASANNLLHDRNVRGIVVNLHDITVRKQAEEEQRFLAEAGAVLATSLEYDSTVARLVELTVPQLGDWCAIDTVDEDGSIRRLAVACRDPEIARLLDELPRRFPIDPNGSHPIAVVLRTGEPVLTPDLVAFLERMADNEEHLRLLRALRTQSRLTVPLVAHGQRLGAISFGFTGSERRHDRRDLVLAEEFAHRAALAIDNARLYHEAQAALEGTQRALGMRDQFLSVASHELRTPLTALKGQIQLAARRFQRGTAEGVPELIRQADQQVERLTGLVRDLLDVSRIAAGGFVIERDPVALGALVQRVVDLERAAAPNHAIHLEMPVEAPAVLADRERIEQVLVNLIENARKYSPHTKPIRVRVGVTDDRVTISVEDRGVGIPPEDQPRIFERFHRASNVDRNVAGLGLGLYIAHQIVQAHGGELTVESTAGVGSTFTVALPCGIEGSEQPPA